MAHAPDEPRPPQPSLPAASDLPALVVGLGASAGGIQALADFFAHVPPSAPIAYVVILHLSPEHESHLAEILQKRSALPVTQVRGDTPLAAGHVYVIPPNETLQVVDGRLVLTPMTWTGDRKAPVDMFFRTLAATYQARSVAVVLSGTGPNGSNGMKRVKEFGGLCIAQSPDEAEYSDMPTNAIGTGLVDYVLPIAEMPARIVEYHDRLSRTVVERTATGIGDEAEAMREVMSLLRIRTGQDFSNYKASTVKRRIARRVSVQGLQSVAEYARLMRDQSDEAIALMKELLISVTNFFRDPAAFAALEQRVIPRLFKDKSSIDQLRVWTAGCATGEEAYSLAMLLIEHGSQLAASPMMQIFATDLDEQAIAIGREGVYADADVADVSRERLRRFFKRDPRGYRVLHELREPVLFAHHNVIKDPPFSHLDLIACRNLLIYLNRNVQERVLETFHYALRPGGYLFLGTSESPEFGSDLFVAIDKEAHIYESRSVASRLPLPMLDRPVPAAAVSALPDVSDPRVAERISPGELHLRLLEQLAPPSVIVTDEFTIVHMSDRAGGFLVIPGGEPTRDLLRIVHPDLRTDLRNALHNALAQRRPVGVQGVRMGGRRGNVVVTITVKPVLSNGSPPRGYFVVVFEELGAPAPPQSVTQLVGPAPPGSEHADEELARMREQLRVTVEQFETESGEAKTANEELQAMNEELRSAAEELETSKEELQSVNEELTTVNQELKIKIEELGLTNNDFQNLINATEIGTIFLDRSLRVKLSTPRAQDVFNLLPSDTGRKLTDINSTLEYSSLQDDVTQVLERLQAIEREVPARDGRWYALRVLPYRTLDDRIDGVALTLQDITSRREVEHRARLQEERLRLLVDSAVDYAIFTTDSDGRIDSWSSGAERMFGFAAADIVGQKVDLLFTAEDRNSGVPERELETARTRGRAEDVRWHLRKDGSRFYCSGMTMALAEGQGFAKIARDLTSQRHTDQALQQLRTELEERVIQRTAELRAEVSLHATAQERVTTLLRKVVTAQEDERARIARDLHDQLGQQLTALRLALERHRGRMTATAGQEDIDHAVKLAGELDTAVDFLAWELRPAALDDLGLAAALPRYVEEWSARYGIAAHFRADRVRSGMLSREAEVTFYRVAQEALNNVLKHAHAERVDLLLEASDHSVVMVIEDNGVGFDPMDRVVLENGIGLAGMRERAALIGATLDIESAAGSGATVFLRCPLATEAPDAR